MISKDKFLIQGTKYIADDFAVSEFPILSIASSYDFQDPDIIGKKLGIPKKLSGVLKKFKQ